MFQKIMYSRKIDENGDLHLDKKHIKNFPKIDGIRNLYLTFCTIDSLPEGLTISGALDMGETKIKKLPLVHGITKLNLWGSTIEELPEKLKINGDLNLTSTKRLHYLPKIEGIKNLFLRGSAIEKFPEGLEIDGELSLNPTNGILQNLPKGIKKINFINRHPILEAIFDVEYRKSLSRLEAYIATVSDIGMIDEIRDFFNQEDVEHEFRGKIKTHKFDF